MVLLITRILYNATLTFKSADVAVQMKVSRLCFYVALFITLYKDMLTFKSLNESRVYDPLNERW